MLTIALQKRCPIKQLDVNNAFLNGVLQEDIYMQQPPGFLQDSTRVCKLKTAIYGLKQTPRVWFEKLKSTLNSLGYSPTKSDSPLFTNINKLSTVYILIYVDHLIVTGNNDEEIQILTKYLHKTFSIKDLGDIAYFLGIEVKRQSNSEIHLCQKKYISEHLIKVNMHEAKP